MSESLDLPALAAWLRGWARALLANEAELTELDAAIGDGDHGTNMARGAHRLLELAADDGARPSPLADLAKAAGMALISSVGGASGPLYGTFWLRFATRSGNAVLLEKPDLAAAFDAGAQGVAQRGKSGPGDKTMLDVLLPAAAALAAEGSSSALAAARSGSDATIALVARRGRASYLGERSAGHRDPGAASSVLLVEAMAKAMGAQP